MPKNIPPPPAEKSPGSALKELRGTVNTLVRRGIREVSAVRDAFATGLPPLQTFSSSSKADFLTRFSDSASGSALIGSTAQLGLRTATVIAPVRPPRPELDFVEVISDRAIGVLDSFVTRVVFSIPTDQLGKISYFRVLRARSGRVDAPVPSFNALAESSPLGARTKSPELLSNMAFRVADVGVGNALTRFVADDSFSGQRAVIASGSLRLPPSPANTNRQGGGPGQLVSLHGGDRSVVEDVVFATNQRLISPRDPLALPLTVGRRNGLNVLQGSSVGSSAVIVSEGNSLGFFELSRITSARGRQVGSFTEFECIDPSVIYGCGYSYYIVAVSRVGFESVRSRIVDVEVVRNVPVESPVVLFSIAGGNPRFNIRCPGRFIDHIEIFRRGGRALDRVRLLSTDRAMIDGGVPIRTESGFCHLGDVPIGSDRIAMFTDYHVAAGESLEYRIYSVDCFGLKSSTPFSCSIVMPDHGAHAPLPKPIISAEQLSGDRRVGITISCDESVGAFYLARRDVGVGEKFYRQPTHPAYFTIGARDALRARSRGGPLLNQFSSLAWNGILQAISGSAQFIDNAVQLDRTYQYSVQAVDVHGNRSQSAMSTPVFVASKPVFDAPSSVSGTLLLDGDIPVGVMVSWTASTIDFSPLDLIGDQDVLDATRTRSVFQVERRAVGDVAWTSLPSTTSSYFIDPVSSAVAPSFRPPYAEMSRVYEYRVIAMQSGAFVSSHTDLIRVSVVPPLDKPPVVVVRSTPTSLRPLSVVLSWHYEGSFVDGWEVERAVTNKLFGARISSMDSSIARGLSYTSVGRITRESSRGLGVSTNDRRSDLPGNRTFTDRDVSMANSYFYRVRAFDILGRTSAWTYAGIHLSDSPFDRKLMSSLSDDERSALTLDPRSLAGWEGR